MWSCDTIKISALVVYSLFKSISTALVTNAATLHNNLPSEWYNINVYCQKKFIYSTSLFYWMCIRWQSWLFSQLWHVIDPESWRLKISQLLTPSNFPICSRLIHLCLICIQVTVAVFISTPFHTNHFTSPPNVIQLFLNSGEEIFGDLPASHQNFSFPKFFHVQYGAYAHCYKCMLILTTLSITT